VARHLVLNGFKRLEGFPSVELRSIIKKSPWRAAFFKRRLFSGIAAWYCDEAAAGGELTGCEFQSGYLTGGIPLNVTIDDSACIFSCERYWRAWDDPDPKTVLIHPVSMPEVAGIVGDPTPDYYGTGALHEFRAKVFLGTQMYVDASKKASRVDQARALLARVLLEKWQWPNSGPDPRPVLRPE
jgi:hypothetical protein